MKTTIEVKEREHYAIIEIVRPNGDRYRITVGDKEDDVEITSVEGSMIMCPKSSNQIQITTASN